MQVTVTVRSDEEVVFVDTLDATGESVTGIVVLLGPGQATVELLKPGQRVVIQEIPLNDQASQELKT